MTIVGVTYQTILNRLMSQSCQLCDVAHDFRYDPHSSTVPHQVSGAVAADVTKPDHQPHAKRIQA